MLRPPRQRDRSVVSDTGGYYYSKGSRHRHRHATHATHAEEKTSEMMLMKPPMIDERWSAEQTLIFALQNRAESRRTLKNLAECSTEYGSLHLYIQRSVFEARDKKQETRSSASVSYKKCGAILSPNPIGGQMEIGFYSILPAATALETTLYMFSR
jgi:hypothetical protein